MEKKIYSYIKPLYTRWKGKPYSSKHHCCNVSNPLQELYLFMTKNKCTILTKRVRHAAQTNFEETRSNI